jgi:hypothetical protein
MELFLQNSSNIPKILDNIKEESYQDKLKKYCQVFTDYDENFDTIAGKTDQENFSKQLSIIYQNLRAFKNFIQGEKERYSVFQKQYLAILNLLSFYEKDVIKNLIGENDDKLVLFNPQNIDISKNISTAEENLINPYDRLFDSFTEDFLDAEAMQEALEGLKNLRETYNKLTKNLTSVNVQLNDLQAGKTNVKNLLSFKNKEDNSNKLMIEKEKLEKDIDNLGQIIKIATFNMQIQIKNFKSISLENYYKELRLIQEDTERNAKIIDTLWDSVIKDKNISEYN